jgi:hypothetical protein
LRPRNNGPDLRLVHVNMLTPWQRSGAIAELNLDATQIGASTGLLSHVVEVLRLNTAGGVAPAGTCDPQATPIVNVPYQAD